MTSFDEKAIENFREYLRIKTAHPEPDYEQCVKFLRKQAKDLNLSMQVLTLVPHKPIVVMTWYGTEPSLRSVLLNSHTDVVPVFEYKWKHAPFAAHMDETGDIYGRGAQDMKCVAIMYLEAIRRLKYHGIKLKRTIHLSFVPDEEIGGKAGVALWVKTKEFKNLNIAFSLDEGAVVPMKEYPLFYGERAMWQIHVHCCGTSGHGSALLPDTPGEKIRHILNRFLNFRDRMILKNGTSIFPTGDITSINLTKLYGGVLDNVVPDKMTAVFDLRIALTENLTDFEAMLNKWCEEAGPNVYMEFKQKDPMVPASIIDDTNPFWVAFKSAIDKLGLTLKPVICPGNTDSRFLREVGITALGFTPINESPLLLHSHNERVNKSQFLKGIGIYFELLQNLANV